MYPRGHRGFAAVLMLLVLVLSAMALLPARAQAATNQVTGLVSQCGTSTKFLGGAQVTLADANGVLPPLTTTTSTDGLFVFTPPAANYTLSVSASGYYSGSPTAPFRFDGSVTVNQDLCLDLQLPPGKTSLAVTFLVVDQSTSAPIGGATVSVYNYSRISAGLSGLVVTNVTNTTTGRSTTSLWADRFEIRVNATGYGLFIENQTIAAAGTITIPMRTQITVVGHAKNADGQFVSAGLTGWLYRLDVAPYNGSKVIKAVVTGSQFSFYAPRGLYRMVVAANGYLTYNIPLDLRTGPTSRSADASPLNPAPPEPFVTTVLFGPRGWNNLTVFHNLTLNADASLPGLNPAGFRSLRTQINYTFGNGYGNDSVSAGDVNAFTRWLLHNGPLYVATDSFLLLNGKSYISNESRYTVTVSSSLASGGPTVSIVTSTTYQVKSKAWITYGQSQYSLSMTVYSDTNTTVYKNQSYIVQLPNGYEMASNTILPDATAITTSNFTRITVDPGLNGQAIRMVIEKSALGVARAKVVGPAGKYYVVNSAYLNYQAFVASNANISFSAAESSNPPSNDSSRENFTWLFLANMTGLPNPPSNIRYGIQPTFLFPQAGAYLVNLTAIGSGGNVTYRNINIYADGSPPKADFRTNLTGTGSANGTRLEMNQGTVVRLDASLSSDLAYAGKSGIIPNSGYAWDCNGDRITDAVGRTVNCTFSKAGEYKVNLTVTDGVGWKSANASMTVQVNDTEAPSPQFTILDPSNEYAPVTDLMEMRNYTFNASKTTDNYNKLDALNFTWTIPGPLIGMTGTPNKLYGMNVTFGWSAFNYSYAVNLTVRDTGFGTGKGNNGTLTKKITVAVDWTLHADLYVNTGSMKIDNTNPQEGQTITITLNVTNKVNRAVARAIRVGVLEVSGTQRTGLATTWTLVDGNGNPLSTQTIASGATVRMEIRATVVGQGNRTISVTVSDGTEPYTAITSENVAQTNIVVSQAGWVTYAIIGAVIAVFAVFIFAMYYRRKVKAGDWQPVRLRREKGEGGKEKPRKEKEVKEEKKRL